MCEKMKMFDSTLEKTEDNICNIWESHWNLYDQKESVSCIEVTKIEEKLSVLVILQGKQASVWVFILVHCKVNFFTFDFWPNLNFPLEHQINLVLSSE